VRESPGKARRARSINAVAAGRMALEQRLALAAEVFDSSGLPMLFRVTRFTLPATLDAELDALGWAALEHTRVMVCPRLAPPLDCAAARAAPAGLQWRTLDAAAVCRCRRRPARLTGRTPPGARQAAAAVARALSRLRLGARVRRPSRVLRSVRA
jgi:hypothetical protein